jgi:HEAT repeat protein
MTAWRIAILNKSPDQVESLDRAFAEHRAAFIPALMESAGGDPEPRVRAFSTRVLGKLQATESRGLMHRLLGDGSEYVRFNAAWAIGELADREATAELERLERRDRSEMVRRSARESLRRLNGG